MKYTVTGSELVSLAEVRMSLKLDTDDTSENDLITTIIKAAREYSERYTGIALVTQNVQGYINLKSGRSYLLAGTISNVSLKDEDDDDVDFDEFGNLIEWEAEDGRGLLSYTVTVTAIPHTAKIAVIQKACELYENRENPVRDRKTLSDRYLDMIRKAYYE